MVFNKCCCFNLQTGAIIIGSLSIVVAIFEYVDGIFDLSTGVIDEYLDKLNINDEQTKDSYRKYMVAAIGTNLFLQILKFIVNICLIYGTVKRKKLFILVWLVENVFEVILGIVFVILLIIACIKIQFYEGFITLVLIVPYMALSLYIWLCMLSLYKQFRNEELSMDQEEQDILVT